MVDQATSSSLPESSRLPVFPALPYTGPKAVREHPKVLTETHSAVADDERGPLNLKDEVVDWDRRPATKEELSSFVSGRERDSLSVVHLIEQNGEGAE